MQYRTDTRRDLRQIAGALGVANVLEGTVRRDGNHVRVSTELVDARDDNTIWADSYDRDLTDIVAIQSEIAQVVASKLSAQLSLEERKNYCYRDFERARVQIAIAEQALPNNPELLELTALIDRVQGRWGKATAAFERATTLDPRNPERLGYLSQTYMYLRRYQEAGRILDREIALEPNSAGSRITKALWAFWEKADVKAARATCEALALADLALGRREESIQAAQHAVEMRPISDDAVDGPGIARLLALVYARASQPDGAFEQLNILIKMPGAELHYGDLKTNPGWDPLRKDPRFDKLLAELAPRD
jgi:tetratricopeptide (TPR) repeat protein